MGADSSNSRTALRWLATLALLASLVFAFIWLAGTNGWPGTESQRELALDVNVPRVDDLELAAVDVPAATKRAEVETERMSISSPVAGAGEASAVLVVRMVSLLHGGPVPDVDVVLNERGDPEEGDPARRKLSATSSRDGEVRFEAVSNVSWALRVRPTDEYGYGDLDVEPLSPGETREIELLLSTAGDVTWFGRVTWHGDPYAGAHVRMLDFDDVGEHTVDEVESDATGLVQFAGSSWRGIDARVDVPGVGLTVVEITRGHETPETAQELPLWPVATLTCTVVDPADSPIADIEVVALLRTYEIRPPASDHAYSPDIRVSGSTDSTGVVRLADVLAELPITFELRRGGELLLEEQRALILPAGSQTERRFVIGGAGRITGRVESVSGPPLAGVEVSLNAMPYAKTSRLFHTAYLQESAAHSTTTDGAGRFVFSDVPYGAWYVGTQGDGKGAEQYALAARVDLSASEPIANVTLRFERGLTIEGRVVGVDGEGIAGAFVQSWNDVHGGLGRLQADDAGAFQFGPLPAGLYNVFVEPPAAFVLLPTVEVAAGTHDLRLVIERGLVLRGTVVDAVSGASVEIATVYAHAPNSDRPFAFHGSVPVHEGRFELTRLPAGEIALRAQTESGGIGILRGIQVQRGNDAPDVTVRLHQGVSVRVRYVGEAADSFAIQALQDGVAVTYIAMKPGETTTFWAMPGPLILRAFGEGVVAEDKELVIRAGDHPEVVLGDRR